MRMRKHAPTEKLSRKCVQKKFARAWTLYPSQFLVASAAHEMADTIEQLDTISDTDSEEMSDTDSEEMMSEQKRRVRYI